MNRTRSPPSAAPRSRTLGRATATAPQAFYACGGSPPLAGGRAIHPRRSMHRSFRPRLSASARPLRELRSPFGCRCGDRGDGQGRRRPWKAWCRICATSSCSARLAFASPNAGYSRRPNASERWAPCSASETDLPTSEAGRLRRSNATLPLTGRSLGDVSSILYDVSSSATPASRNHQQRRLPR